MLLDPRTLVRLERLVTVARRTRPRGRRKPARPRPGRGIEHGSRRDYAAGDDLRMVDWPAYARLERLLIKVQEELPEPCMELIIDGSGSMGRGHPSPHLRASLAAAALAATGVARQVCVSMWWAGAGYSRMVLRRPGQLVALLRFLDALNPAGGSSGLDACVTRICATRRARGGAVLLSDGLDPRAITSAAAKLRAHGFSTLVVMAGVEVEVAPSAAAPANEAGLAELVDAETGARRLAPFTAMTLDLAARARAGRTNELGRLLEDVGIPLEALDPSAPFEAVALGLLS